VLSIPLKQFVVSFIKNTVKSLLFAGIYFQGFMRDTGVKKKSPSKKLYYGVFSHFEW